MAYEITSAMSSVSVLRAWTIYITHKNDEPIEPEYMVAISVENGIIDNVQWFKAVEKDHYHPCAQPTWFEFETNALELIKQASEMQ